MKHFQDMLIKEYSKDKKISSSKDIIKELKSFYSMNKEVLIVVSLDTNNQIISREVVSIGTLNSSLIHPREVFKLAILNSANSIIIAHNHPSGNLEFSDDDNKIYDRLVESGDILGIKVLDFLIFDTKGNYANKEAA